MPGGGGVNRDRTSSLGTKRLWPDVRLDKLHVGGSPCTKWVMFNFRKSQLKKKNWRGFFFLITCVNFKSSVGILNVFVLIS